LPQTLSTQPRETSTPGASNSDSDSATVSERVLIGLDLGQARDYTAISAIEQVWDFKPSRYDYYLRFLERPALGTPYPAVVQRVTKIFQDPRLRKADGPYLVLDKTGVGAPVADLFMAEDLQPISITITGGGKPSRVAGGYTVPKRDLVMALLVVFQSGRFHIPQSLPLAKIFTEELQGFQVKIDPKTAHDSYEAWREGAHDDLVLSAALAVWFGEYRFARHG